MPLPLNAVTFAQPLDPGDVLDFVVAISQGAVDAFPTPILLPGETIASYSLSASVEAVALGLQVKTGGGWDPKLTGNLLTFWVGVAAGQQYATIFDGLGVAVGVELTITTNSAPARVKQRTIAITVRQLGQPLLPSSS